LPADVTGIEVIDARGRVWQLLRPTGADVLEVDMQACPAGIYVIRVTGPTGSAGIKVVKL
jgi:hypothetical protein